MFFIPTQSTDKQLLQSIYSKILNSRTQQPFDDKPNAVTVTENYTPGMSLVTHTYLKQREHAAVLPHTALVYTAHYSIQALTIMYVFAYITQNAKFSACFNASL